MSGEEKPIIAWVGITCPYCGTTQTAEVREVDARGKNKIYCSNCEERIPVQ